MYIGRKPDGTVYGLWSQQQPNDADHPGIEEVPDNHPDVLAFQNRPVPGGKRKTVEERLAALETKVP